MPAQKIEPNILFTVYTPDEAAECLISTRTQMGRDVYEKIWDQIVPLLPKKTDEWGERYAKYEVPEVYEEEQLAAFWGKFTPEEQEFLNTQAENES